MGRHAERVIEGGRYDGLTGSLRAGLENHFGSPVTPEMVLLETEASLLGTPNGLGPAAVAAILEWARARADAAALADVPALAELESEIHRAVLPPRMPKAFQEPGDRLDRETALGITVLALWAEMPPKCRLMALTRVRRDLSLKLSEYRRAGDRWR